LAKTDDIGKFRDEYIKKSVLTNRIFMIMLGISILLLLFVFIPYYLSLEHLKSLKDEKIQFQTEFDRFSSFNTSLFGYYQYYGQIAEPLIDNDFKNISQRINDMILTGKSIYPQCDHIVITGDFFRCNIKLMAGNEYDYLIKNQSNSILLSSFQSKSNDWKLNYEPRIVTLQNLLRQDYIVMVNSSNTISSFLQIPERLSQLTKDYFEKDLPKIVISVFLGVPIINGEDSIDPTQASLRDLILSFKSNLTKVESDILSTENLISSITKRIGDIGTPVGSIALGFEEILVFSPVILAFFYFAFLYLLHDAIGLKKENIPKGDIVDKINPLILYSTSSKKIKSLLTASPLFLYGIYSFLMLAIWSKFDPFFVFDAFFWVFVFIYVVCGILVIFKLYQTFKLINS
jgi:hypothetical protein